MKSGIVGPNYRGSYAFPQKFCSFGSGLAKLLLVKEHLFPPYKMFKKIIKYTFRVVLCGLVLLIVLPFLLYIPGIQNFYPVGRPSLTWPGIPKCACPYARYACRFRCGWSSTT